MRVTYWDSFWSAADVRAHPTYAWVFGDNTKRRGRLGQACIRGCARAFGIPTQNDIGARFFRDAELARNSKYIDAAIDRLLAGLRADQAIDTLVLPKNMTNKTTGARHSLGLGLSKLYLLAPKTYAHLCARVDELVALVADL